MRANNGSLAADISVVLARHGLPAMTEAWAQRLARVLTTGGVAPMSGADEAFLAAHAGPYADASLIDPDIYEAAFAPWPDLPTLSTREVARRLNIDRSTVTRRAKSGRLLAYVTELGYVFPAWQFDHTSQLPGLSTVVVQVPAGWGARRLARFMTTPDETLDDRTPRDWLSDNRPPLVVADLMHMEAQL